MVLSLLVYKGLPGLADMRLPGFLGSGLRYGQRPTKPQLLPLPLLILKVRNSDNVAYR